MPCACHSHSGLSTKLSMNALYGLNRRNRCCTIPGSTMHSILKPPWAGGRFPLREQGPFEATQPPVTCCPVCFPPTEPVVEGGDKDRHFHQPFRQLRLREHRALRGRVERDLGHDENRLGLGDVKTLQDVRRLVDHLRHKNVESRSPRDGPRCAAELSPAARLASPAAPLRCYRRATQKTSHPRLRWSSGSVERCSWPRQWQSSVSVELSVVSLQPLPVRSTAAHAARQHAVVAPPPLSSTRRLPAGVHSRLG